MFISLRQEVAVVLAAKAVETSGISRSVSTTSVAVVLAAKAVETFTLYSITIPLGLSQ